MALLPEMIQKIAEKIIADDWLEWQSPEGEQSYYVIGAEAYRDDLETHDYTLCRVSPGVEVGPLAEHVVRSQLAAGRGQDYLKRERKRLEKAGIKPATIDRFIEDPDARQSLFPELFPQSISGIELLYFLQPFLEALRVAQGGVTLDHEETEDVSVARAKLCLREVARKYGKIVDKWEQLEPLPFDDPQLEEASRAFLYGFYRASVVLSASALERHLKLAAGVERSDRYLDLVEDAAAALGMGRAWIAQAIGVFRLRNRVVHDGHDPTHNEAGEILSNARGVLTSFLSDQ